jgi:hypothetical protein
MPNAETLSAYFTVIIPWTSTEFRTQWHPTEKEGPFAELSRGAFTTEALAVRWGRDQLNGTPYSVKRIDP